MKGQPLRRFMSDARQAFEFIDEFCYWFGVIEHSWWLVVGGWWLVVDPTSIIEISQPPTTNHQPPFYINPGIFNPPSAPPRRLLAVSSTLRPHSLIAATIRSCNISISLAASGSIFTERTSLSPFISTFTMP